MIVPDVNLLIYAYNLDAPLHEPARAWWESAMRSKEPIGIPWAVALGFVRLMTQSAVLAPPLEPVTAVRHVETWLSRSHVQVLEPGPRHLSVLRDLFGSLRVAGRLTTDAHIAAIAIEHQCELHSNDLDFGRFPGLRWRNPLRA